MGGPAGDRSSDTPLVKPEQDLLGIAQHAAVLANTVLTVSTPFTIGVYGEWGAGKTTFVNFVRHYLDRPANPATAAPAFVYFEGWQHRTADELWRALVIDIARAIYRKTYGDAFIEGPTPPTNAAPANGKANGRRTLRGMLDGDALVLRRAETDPTPNDRYLEIVRRLDSTMYGGISKRPEASGLDTDQAMIAAVKASVAALGAVSPVIGALRAFFKLDDGIDASGVFQRDQNQATRERIESKREFRETLQMLLKELPAETRICVFLDDLDRCMPDVVLDLLEAIKIFLDVPGIVFIVAADETLIGKGLNLRFKDLLATNDSDAERAFLTRKGQEYFEKIIQLRINLPECTAEHAHRFITAQFPEWMPATDIILAAVGSNPRRIKQYCSWLAFRQSVDQAAAAR